MGWLEVIGDLEERVESTFAGRNRPLDNVPFFRVQYPPAELGHGIGASGLLHG